MLRGSPDCRKIHTGSITESRIRINIGRDDGEIPTLRYYWAKLNSMVDCSFEVEIENFGQQFCDVMVILDIESYHA